MSGATTATYIAIAGAAVSAIGSISQGMAASKAAKSNAAVASRNADIAGQQANADADAQARKNMQMMGAARAAYGASGVTPDGSPLDVLSSAAALGELDRQNILYNGRLRQIGYQESATADTESASTALTKGIFNAGKDLFEGGADYYKNNADPTMKPAKTSNA